MMGMKSIRMSLERITDTQYDKERWAELANVLKRICMQLELDMEDDSEEEKDNGEL